MLSSLAIASKSHWGYAEEQLEAWRQDLTVTPTDIHSAAAAYVAASGCEVLGYYLITADEPHWRLEHLWVATHCMGTGIGRALLTHAAVIARQAGAVALAIDADPNAEPFYLARGASRVGAIAAPIDGSPRRERPQLLLNLVAFRA